MLRLARLRAKDYGRTSEEDTLDLIKLIIEWRGRVSIVTEADEFYAAEKLSLNPENAKGLLDLYEIIGPGAGYVTPSYDDDDEEDDDESALAKSGSKGLSWVPPLKDTQDEVDEIVLAILGPNFKAPSTRNTPEKGQGEVKFDENSLAAEDDEEGDDVGSGSVQSGSLSMSSAAIRRRKALPSPIESTWIVETRKGKAVRIAVSHEGFTGNIPQSIRRLTSLEVLELPCLRPWLDPESAHELIPTKLRPKLAMDIAATATLGHLPSLTKLDLHGNLLTGTIPVGLGHLSVLKELDLSRNRFAGDVPHELGKLKNLISFDACSCRLNGVIEEGFIRGCTSLEVLMLSQNMLKGVFPGEALACLTNLRELDLSHNTFVGALSVEMPNRLRKCERLLLNDNQLHGRLPSTLMDLTACRELDLSNNNFKGRLPLAIGSLHRSLTYVDVSQNEWNDEEKEELLNFLTPRLYAAVPNVIV